VDGVDNPRIRYVSIIRQLGQNRQLSHIWHIRHGG
jgi:hypothetical protein